MLLAAKRKICITLDPSNLFSVAKDFMKLRKRKKAKKQSSWLPGKREVG